MHKGLAHHTIALEDFGCNFLFNNVPTQACNTKQTMLNHVSLQCHSKLVVLFGAIIEEGKPICIWKNIFHMPWT